MEFLVVPLVAALVGALTLVSGFGLGTVLMPVFAVFFPVEVAIAATGVVHLVNNLFKLGLVGKHAVWQVVRRFGIPAVVAAFVGGWLMTMLAATPTLHSYTLGPIEARMTWLKIAAGVLLGTLAALELLPAYQRLTFPPKMLPIGGALSGFVGGISGMQGALRAPFLLKAGLSKDQFVGTANVLSTMVDLARLGVYFAGFAYLTKTRDYGVLSEPRTIMLVVAACVGGCTGSLLGRRIFKNTSLESVRIVVSVLLFIAAVALIAGVV